MRKLLPSMGGEQAILEAMRAKMERMEKRLDADEDL